MEIHTLALILNQHIHHNKMAYTSAHNEEMENFVGAKVFMFTVENRKFQSIDYTADGIDQSAGEEPHKGCSG